jgi:hypothetical protein
MNTWETRPSPYKVPTPPWKRQLGERCPHRLEIFMVDGTFVRNHFDSDFVQGGNGYAYNFIPKSEIWISHETPNEEIPMVAFHECFEALLMENGLDYDHAHDIAKMEEDKFRRLLT